MAASDFIGAAPAPWRRWAPGWLLARRGTLFPFAAVAFGLGVGVYFALPFEPVPDLRWALAGAALLALAVAGPEDWRPLFIAALLFGAGVVLGALRTASVAAPVLAGRYYGPVEGRIVLIDRAQSGALRLTLDRVTLADRSPARTPARVRITLHADPQTGRPLEIGLPVMTTASLGPPSGPVEPGGFDFRRIAWFERLGAVGYTRAPVLARAPPEGGWTLWQTRLRMQMSHSLRDRLPGESGGFVAAVLTGDRSGVTPETTEALRRSNLAHLLAISGLHMGLLAGAVFVALRAALATSPRLALSWPIRKIAALGALAAAAFYLILSGGNVATQRAFVMAAVMLGAVLVERRALSLRSVALAALIVLIWRPESVLTAGFQMSFAATLALVAVFGALRGRWRYRPGRLARWGRGLRDLVICSLVAGLATAPYAAAQFHRVADYGLIANLLAVPLMGSVIMPAAVAAAVLWPIGFEGAALWVMDMGARWILAVARWVGGLDSAVRPVTAPPSWVIPLFSLGMLWLILWAGRARWVGAGIAACALAGWGWTERPALLISETGALVGIMGPQGRVLSRARGEGFAASAWLSADGDDATQAVAAARAGMADQDAGRRLAPGGVAMIHLPGPQGASALPAACAQGLVVITDQRIVDPPPGCLVLDARALAQSGARAAWVRGEGLRWLSARDVSGARPWAKPPVNRP
jgi:competence protein ComEC